MATHSNTSVVAILRPDVDVTRTLIVQLASTVTVVGIATVALAVTRSLRQSAQTRLITTAVELRFCDSVRPILTSAAASSPTVMQGTTARTLEGASSAVTSLVRRATSWVVVHAALRPSRTDALAICISAPDTNRAVLSQTASMAHSIAAWSLTSVRSALS